MSRGDGKIGEDILKNLSTIKSIPKKIIDRNLPEILEVRCEIFISKTNFNKIKSNFAIPETLLGEH